jgi:hypothetical protein
MQTLGARRACALQRALDGCERVLGKGIPTLTSVNNLAGCMLAWATRRGSAALPARSTAVSACSARSTEHTRQREQSGPMLGGSGRRRGLPLYQRVLGKEHQHALTSVNNLLLLELWATRRGFAVLPARAQPRARVTKASEHAHQRENLAFCLEALGDSAALPSTGAPSMDLIPIRPSPSSRTARANWDRLEREVAARAERLV